MSRPTCRMLSTTLVLGAGANVVRFAPSLLLNDEDMAVAKMKRMEEKRIPANIDWDDIDSIATEARQKFKLINPETIGQASRISGVNPADISILMVYLEGKNRSISKNQEKKA